MLKTPFAFKSRERWNKRKKKKIWEIDICWDNILHFNSQLLAVNMSTSWKERERKMPADAMAAETEEGEKRQTHKEKSADEEKPLSVQ